MRRAPALLLLLLVATPAVAFTEESRVDAIERALSYVGSQQQGNGRWLLTSQGYPAEAAAAAGRDPRTWPSRDASAYAALTPEACTQPALPDAQQPCYLTLLRVVHAAGASGYDPRDLHGIDGVERIRAGFAGGQFGNPRIINDDIWAILALRAANVAREDPMIRAAVANVWRARTADGGWSDATVATRGNTDMTAMALAALAAAGEPVRGDDAAKRFLLAHWDTSGAFSDGFIGPNVQSTVWATHGLAILGAETNRTALDHILSNQRGDGSIGSGLWSTTEAIVVLTGARYPLPSYTPTTPPAPRGHAREPIPLGIPGATRVALAFDDGVRIEGPSPTRTFDAAGTYAFRVVADAPGARWRGEGNVTVLSARPTLPAFPTNVTAHRHAAVSLDVSRARDPDGRVVGFEVDWGDGNVTNTTSHAYSLPGNYSVALRAQDDAGYWSEPARVRVDVANRAPDPPRLPARILADRVAGVTLDPPVSDPDGDPLALTWTYGNETHRGALALLPADLGETPLRLLVEDPYGATSAGETIVEVVNTPPHVRLDLPLTLPPGVPLTLRANASDPDGMAPALAWSVDGIPVDADEVRLEPGARRVRVVARDADGAQSADEALVHVEDAPPPREPPVIRDLRARIEDGHLLVWSEHAPADAKARLSWRTRDAAGEIAPGSPARIPVGDATWAVATLTVENDASATTRDTGLLLAPVEEPAAQVPPSPARPPSVRVAPEPETPRQPAPPERGEARVEPHAAITSPPPAPAQTPLGWALAVLAIALATRGRRGRSA